MISRRDFLMASGGALTLGTLAGCKGSSQPPWDMAAYRKRSHSRVAILGASSYEGDLRNLVLSGLDLSQLDVRGKRIVIKPNLVEFDPDGVINTHPNLIGSTVEAFRALGSGEVTVAEGPGHRRDNQYLLAASGLDKILRDVGAPYVDLNQDSVRRVQLKTRFTPLGELYMPRTILDADLLVSMPKLKTHHWAGVTISLKNMFGIVPGSVYGWPKNILHWPGIGNSILDINASLETPRFNIVDGIVGMEGDGPIAGDAIQSGVVVFGSDPVAVDATCARLMTVEPGRIDYLREASAFLGNVGLEEITQVGETLESLRKDFRVLETFQGIKVGSQIGS